MTMNMDAIGFGKAIELARLIRAYHPTMWAEALYPMPRGFIGVRIRNSDSLVQLDVALPFNEGVELNLLAEADLIVERYGLVYRDDDGTLHFTGQE